MSAFSLDTASSPVGDELTQYKILSVEDNLDYQEALVNSLSTLNLEGKTLEVLTANTSTQAASLISTHLDISVILLDVVMETDEAGLRLINTIREGLGNDLVRIVLLTGQPGIAPANDIMSTYDIDDYWCKSDLTHDHLQTIIVSNLRTWDHLKAMYEARQGLQLVVESSQRLSKKRDMAAYTKSVLDEVTQLLNFDGGGVVCSSKVNTKDGHKPLVVAANGEYVSYIDHPLETIATDKVLVTAIEEASSCQSHVFLDGYSVLYFSNEELGDDAFITVVKSYRQLASNDVNLLQVMCENINVGFRNVALHGKLTQLAYYVSGGMYNKNWLVRELRNMSYQDRQDAQLLMLHVEDFIHMQTVFGFEFGQQLMSQLYQHLRHYFSCGVDIALLERDTLAVILYERRVFDEESLAPIVNSSFHFKNARHTVDIVAGLVELSVFADYSPEQIICAGESALEQAHHSGLSFLTFSAQLANDMVERYALLKDLRQAIVNNDIHIFLQPKVSLADGRLIGFEALARWQDAEGNYIPPDVFIPLAESCGLIGKLDDSILQQACQAILMLKEKSISVPISVNVAGSELVRAEYFDRLQTLLESDNIPPYLIELEITESQLIQEKTILSSRLESLKNMGVRIDVDDFGTGYSSLAYLSTLPVSTLKIDHSFVWSMGSSQKDLKVLTMIIELGKTLGLNVIAEGIETQEQYQQLRALGCHEGQGYLFSPPIPVNRIENWLIEYSKTRV